MTETRAELLLASKNKATNVILYTFRITMPRIILPELATHRVFSKSTSSTRAIPTLKMIKTVLRDMFVPSYIGAAQKGMQAGAELTGLRRSLAVAVWKSAGYFAALHSYLLYKLGVAKQISGRLVEPFSWTTMIVSMTEIDNFFLLRDHPAAEPHIAELAAKMKADVVRAKAAFKIMEKTKVPRLTNEEGDAYQLQILNPGQYHLPLTFIREENTLPLDSLKRISTARSARTSYTLLETGKLNSVAADVELCARLFGGQPMHLSPTEHCAQAMDTNEYHANFKSFRQFRKEVEGEPTVSIPEVIKPKDAGLLGKVRELRPKAVTFQMEELKWYVLSGSPKVDKSWKIIGEGDCEVRALENALKVLESA